ncbi:defensin-like protein 1 [Ricinus communis]|uniref:defensin-like protein 1 n=1 Tax=Ricinus communis TaxID=3988 RepID=UPI0000D6D428|nr:defensin-like protein 1 [Ricinus communis]|eukprot:XP_015578658.1 defensin-like protein 1 [Ricinus communis]
MEKRSAGLFILMLIVLVLASQHMVLPTEARVCQSQSHKFHGACWGDHNCATVCRTEGFSGGRCRGFRRKCFCTRGC